MRARLPDMPESRTSGSAPETTTSTSPASAESAEVTGAVAAIKPIDVGILAAVATGAHHNPHAVLGAHPYQGGVTVRTLRPLAKEVAVVVADGTRYPLVHERNGIWVGA